MNVFTYIAIKDNLKSLSGPLSWQSRAFDKCLGLARWPG